MNVLGIGDKEREFHSPLGNRDFTVHFRNGEFHSALPPGTLSYYCVGPVLASIRDPVLVSGRIPAFCHLSASLRRFGTLRKSWSRPPASGPNPKILQQNSENNPGWPQGTPGWYQNILTRSGNILAIRESHPQNFFRNEDRSLI